MATRLSDRGLRAWPGARAPTEPEIDLKTVGVGAELFAGLAAHALVRLNAAPTKAGVTGFGLGAVGGRKRSQV